MAAGEFTAYSLSQRHASPAFFESYGHLPIFIFTENDRGKIEEYLANPSIHVVLTDDNSFDLEVRDGR